MDGFAQAQKGKMMSDLISRQAMLDGIDNLIKIHFDRTVVLYKARKVAEDLPSAQPEPEAISKWKKEFREYVDSLDIARDDWKGIVEYIDDVPAVQPDDDRLERCRFEYINACKILAHRTPDTRKKDIDDAYAVVRALNPIFGEEGF